LKHLKRRNAKKKKRDASSKKKEKKKEKEKEKEKGNKTKKHQSSLSTKIDRNLEGGRSKKSSIQELHEKKGKKKKTRKASESTSKILKKRKKDLKSSKNSDGSKNMFVSGEIYMNSLYTDKEDGPSEKPKKKKGKKKNTLKSSKESKKKNFKMHKKNKDSPKDLNSKDRKRYLSVNAGKNPLLDSELMQNFNPRKTLNPKTISFKRGNSFKSNDIQKTDLFTYKFKRDSLKKDLNSKQELGHKKKESHLYASQEQKGLQTALYQRNRSQVSSDNDEANQGLYKNLYSGRHEKNILEYNSNQSKSFSF
jgi:hypothetical protein